MLFVPDGLRALMATPQTAPAMAAIRDRASISPTRIRCSRPSRRPTPRPWRPATISATPAISATRSTPASRSPSAGDSVTPFLESDRCWAMSTSISPATTSTRRRSCRRRATQGYSTAAIGKLGPALIFDHTDAHRRADHRRRRRDRHAPTAFRCRPRCSRGAAAGGPAARGAGPRRQRQGRQRRRRPAPRSPTSTQQDYFADVATKVGAAAVQGARQAVRSGVLVARPRRHPAQSGRQPRSADARHQRPDLARRDQERRRQSRPHSRRRSPISASPRRPTSSSPPITASRRSPSRARPAPPRRRSYADVPPGLLPPGFRCARSRRRRSACRSSTPTTRTRPVAAGTHPRCGNGLIGTDPDEAPYRGRGQWRLRPRLSPAARDRALAGSASSPRCSHRTMSAACSSTTSSAVSRARLPLSAINLHGAAVTPHAGDRRQFPLVRHRLRRAGDMHGRDRRHAAAAGPGHARQFQPRRHDEFHGRDRARLQDRASSIRRRSATPISAGRSPIFSASRSRNKGKLVGRVLSEAMPGGDGAAIQCPLRAIRCRRRRVHHAARFPDRWRNPVFRRRRHAGPHLWPERQGRRRRGAVMEAHRTRPVHIIGGGLAGSEAAWQVARAGVPVVLHEMRPVRGTEAHARRGPRRAGVLQFVPLGRAERNAVGLLHEEMRRCGSLILAAGGRAQGAGRRRAGGRPGRVFRGGRGRAGRRAAGRDPPRGDRRAAAGRMGRGRSSPPAP